MAQSVNTQDRFNSPSRRCPICSGWERGNPQCKGYLGERPGVVFCTSSDYAGILVRGDTGAFRHWTGLTGCKCGVSHLPSNNHNNHSNHSNYSYYSKPKAEPMINHDGSSRPKTVEETYPYGGGCFVDRVLTGYTKEDGKPEKTFQQYQVIDGKKVYQGFKKLYRIDEVRASGKGFYFLVEGERKVNKLWEMGFPATCNVGGSGSWADSYADELPQGATAYIWPDNDDAGLKWADKIITSLSARKIKWHIMTGLALAANKSDVMDWVKLPGNDAAKIQQEMDKFAPAKMLWSLTELAKFPKPEWLVGGVIKKNSLAFLVGPPKCGKSFYALMLALMIASVGGRVIYIGAEDPGGFYQRGMAWCERNRVDPKILEGHLFFWVKPVALHDEGERRAFIALVKEQFQPDMILIDTLAMNSFGLDENSTKDMGIYIQALIELRNATLACLFTIHHTNRAGEYRGSSALPGAADTFLQAEPVGDPLHKGGTLKIKCVLQRGAKPFEDKFYVAVAVMETLVLIPDGEATIKAHTKSLSESEIELLKILAGPEGKNGMKVKELCDYAGWDAQDNKRKNAFRTMRILTENEYTSLLPSAKFKYYVVTQKGRDVVEQGVLEFEKDEDF